MVLHFRHETERILTSSCSEKTKTYIFEGLFFGAVEKTRTSTPVKEQRPQRCASTNSATTARSWSGGNSEIWAGCEVAI